MKPIIFLGLPLGSRQCDIGAAMSWCAMCSRRPDRYDIKLSRGMLGYTFNNLWKDALNLRADGCTHFAMIHSDVEADDWWLDTLWDIIHERNADMVSAVISLKDGEQNTSTGIQAREGGQIRKLNFKEVWKLPETFSARDVDPTGNSVLALNTGLWIADIHKPWVDEKVGNELVFSWTSRGGIRYVNGEYESWVHSEDYIVTPELGRRGCVMLATKAVTPGHWGWVRFGSDKPKEKHEPE